MIAYIIIAIVVLFLLYLFVPKSVPSNRDTDTTTIRSGRGRQRYQRGD